MTSRQTPRGLPAVVAGIAAACCIVHLTLLAVGVGAVTAAATGASVVALGITVLAAGLWWASRRRTTQRSEPDAGPRAAEADNRMTALPGPRR